MEKHIVFDIEANGLLNEATTAHCLVAKDILNNHRYNLIGPEVSKEYLLDIFNGATKIIGHNIIGYDLRLIKKLNGLDIIKLVGREAIIDTFIWSQCLYPDRPMPYGCPTTIKNPITSTTKRIGPHGLESWGWRVGRKKVEIHDWRVYDDDMLNRCKEDVEINELTFFALLKEANIENKYSI